MKEWVYKAYVLAVVAMLHVISFLQIQEASIGLGFPYYWQAQSLILLAICFSLTVSIVFISMPTSRWALMLIALLVIVLVGLPSGQYLGQQLALFTALILVSCSYISVASSIGVSAIAVTLFMVLKHPLSAWGIPVPAPTLKSAIAASLAVIGCALVSNILSHLHKRLMSIKSFHKNVEDVSQRLIQANLRLQEYASLSEEAAITSERKRLARDLHDTSA
jgi:signal transduction histidine kinase